MKILAFIQARMSSSRFPGKVLHPVYGRLMLSWVLDALKRVKGISGFVIVTSTETSDDPVSLFCERESLPCFRGSLTDVAERFRGAIEHFRPDAFLRISADSPLLDFRVAEQGVRMFREGAYDIVTNVMERSFPKGQSVEVVRSSCFIESSRFFESPEDREHVTPFFYRHRDRYRILNFRAPEGNFSSINLCVDDKAGLIFCESILGRLQGRIDAHPWQDVVALVTKAAVPGGGV